MTIFSDKSDDQQDTTEHSIDDVIPDAKAEVAKLEGDVEHPAHALLTEIENFFDTFKVKGEEDLTIAKAWIKLQVGKVKAAL